MYYSMKKGVRSSIIFLLLLLFISFALAQDDRSRDEREEDIEDLIIETEETVNYEHIEESLGQERDARFSNDNMGDRVSRITQRIVRTFEGKRKAEELTLSEEKKHRKEAREKLVDSIVTLQKSIAIDHAKRTIEDHQEREFERENLDFRSSTENRLGVLKQRADFLDVIGNILSNMGLSEGIVPQLERITPNPLDFTTCLPDESDGPSITATANFGIKGDDSSIQNNRKPNAEPTCDVILAVSDVYDVYEGAGDEEFTFIVVNAVQPDGSLGGDLHIYVFDYTSQSPTSGIITIPLISIPSQTLQIRVANYYKTDVTYSQPTLFNVYGAMSSSQPTITAMTPNPADLSFMLPDVQGLYTINVTGDLFFPPYVDTTLASTTFVFTLLDDGNETNTTFTYPFSYISPEEVQLLFPPINVSGNYSFSVVAYNYLDEALAASEPYFFTVISPGFDEPVVQGPLNEPFTLTRALPTGISDFGTNNELVTFSIPLGEDHAITDAQLALLGSSVLGYQATELVPWQSGETKWALIHALVNYDGAQTPSAFNAVGGPGVSSGPTVCSVIDEGITANTGLIDVVVRGQNFKGLETVTLQDGTVVVDATTNNGALGVVVKDALNDKVYASAYDSNAEATIVYNGPVLCEIEIKGALYTAEGEEYDLDFATYLTFVKGKDYVKEWTSFENDKRVLADGTITKQHVSLDYARFSFASAQDTQPDTVGLSHPSNPAAIQFVSLQNTDGAYAIMGETTGTEHQQGSWGYVPEVINFEGYTVGTLNGGSSTVVQATGSGTQYPDDVIMVARNSASNVYILAALTYAPYDWAGGVSIENGIISAATLPEYVPDANKQYSIAWRQKRTGSPHLYQFGTTGDGEPLSDYSTAFQETVHQHEYPLHVFPTDYNYFNDQTAGTINGNEQKNVYYPATLLSYEDHQELNEKMGIPTANLLPGNEALRWTQFIQSAQGGGGETNRDVFNWVLLSDRAGAAGSFPGGKYLNKYTVARHRLDESVRYLDGESCADYSNGNTWNSGSGVLGATNDGQFPVTQQTFWEQAHLWADVFSWYWLTTGEPLFKEAYDYSAEHAKCAWYLNTANWENHRAAAQPLYMLGQHYQFTYDQEDLDKIEESLSDALNQPAGTFTADTSGSTSKPELKLSLGWINPPGQDLVLSTLDDSSAVSAWVDSSKAVRRGHWTGKNSGNDCKNGGEEVRPWMLTHRMMNGLAYAWSIMDEGSLKDLLEQRIVDIAYMANNDQGNGMIYLDYNNAANSGYWYSYCFSQADFYSETLNQQGMEYQQEIPFIMAYRITGEEKWLQKAEALYRNVAWKYNNADGQWVTKPGYIQGLIYHQTFLNEADEVGYFS